MAERNVGVVVSYNFMSKEQMPFIVLADALSTIKELELSLQDTNVMHCALGGSMIYKGFSNDDIDILIYARKPMTNFPKPEILNSALVKAGLKPATRNTKSKHPRTILNTFNKLGQKIDLFMFDFTNPSEEELSAYSE